MYFVEIEKTELLTHVKIKQETLSAVGGNASSVTGVSQVTNELKESPARS